MLHFVLKPPLVLASQSVTRQKMLRALGLDFLTVKPDFNEEVAKKEWSDLSLPLLAERLAQGKAQSMSHLYQEDLVLAADQIGECEGEALFKPHTIDNNIRQLKFLSGKIHYQHTSACLFLGGECLQVFNETVSLRMRPLSDHEITTYVQVAEPLECCGGYRFEGLGKHLFADIEGSPDSVMGLPLLAILNYLYQNHYLRFAG